MKSVTSLCLFPLRLTHRGSESMLSKGAPRSIQSRPSLPYSNLILFFPFLPLLCFSVLCFALLGLAWLGLAFLAFPLPSLLFSSSHLSFLVKMNGYVYYRCHHSRRLRLGNRIFQVFNHPVQSHLSGNFHPDEPQNDDNIDNID